MLFAGGGDVFAGSPPTLFVFVPSDQKTVTVERALQSSLGALQVTVFGKARDFDRAVASQNPSAVMALPPNLDELGLKPTLSGVRAGATTEPYVLITVGTPMSPNSLVNDPVGAFGILDRRGMKDLYGKLLGTGTQDVVTVTKYEDLLPLLQFQGAKGVVLPERYAGLLTDRSQLKLVVNQIPNGRLGVAAVAIRDGASAAIVESAIKSMDSTSRKYLGVDAWK